MHIPTYTTIYRLHCFYSDTLTVLQKILLNSVNNMNLGLNFKVMLFSLFFFIQHVLDLKQNFYSEQINLYKYKYIAITI